MACSSGWAFFDAWLPQRWASSLRDGVALRLALAAATFATLTYVMVLLEPKDRVLYRWLGAEAGRGRLLAAAGRLQGWMMSYLAAFATVLALIVWVLEHDLQTGPVAALALSALGFVTRDVAIFVLLQVRPGQRRGDCAALVALFSLYVLAPAILQGLGLRPVLVAFYPQAGDPVWLSPALAWAQAVLVAMFAVLRLSIRARPAAAAA
jgi:hypothetical protein